MKNLSIDPYKTVSDIVQEDYRTADAFEKFNINYCSGENITLLQACETSNIRLGELQKELERVCRDIFVFNQLDYDHWKVDFLIDYIVNVHHAYLKSRMPVLLDQVTSFVNNYKNRYPYLENVSKSFVQLIAQLTLHIGHEEELTFPYMKQIENAYKRKESYGNLLVRTLRKPLINHEEEHLKIDELFRRLRSATNNYSFPSDACVNHQVIYHKLNEFDDDMTQHKYLEDEILFPKSMNMERELLHIQS